MQGLEVLDKRNILENEVTTYGDLENPLFLAKDVAEWIGYDSSSVNKMINIVDDDEKLIGKIFRSGQFREMYFLTEDGLYEVLMQSRKPIAKLFKKQVKKLLKELRLNNNPLANLSKEMQAIFVLDKKQEETIKKVDYIYDVMTIDYEQQLNLFQMARDKAVSILGGKHTPSYKRYSRKLFQELWRDYKKFFKVNSYKNTARKNYEEAILYLSNWNPSYNLQMEIDTTNSQIAFN
ncbi:ORF6C domain-containing protein [Paraclostridium sordellii]|uniref:ORF6C domain-containing protein n=1 Tax=Paraclostridium sordellii TaxID=1505 RepID=UPI0005E027F8|nr:ORF6C domain-containing protein [Paeniclostridium sordellii]CEN77426.1 prophage antirepressor [[Clostridium] sordellii] [Paeniclostridium sordellii]CEP92078.1 prophage antirepressor [[Clostridium] sordellii] [Paeniclostridium sordellii]